MSRIAQVYRPNDNNNINNTHIITLYMNKVFNLINKVILSTGISCWLLCSGCTHPSALSKEDKEMNRFISELMDKMTLREKLGQLNLPSGGDMLTGTVMSGELSELIRKQEIGGMFNVKGVEKIRELQRIAVEETRLGIPLIVGADIIHGYRTIFPIPLAMACSWDSTAVERMAQVSAKEAAANGICWTFSPMVDICRDARWGRIAESNGEDPYLGSVLARAYVRGYQGTNLQQSDSSIVACLKHFALYGASESGRDYNITDMSRVCMYNNYFPPYLAAIQAGVGTVMSSFNTVDGIPATANKWLLNDLLRQQWGFDDMVVTDYNSIAEINSHGVAPIEEAAVLALNAGTDMDMVTHSFFAPLEQALADGRVTQNRIDEACRRVLETKYKLGLFDNPYKYCDTLRAATRSFTPENRTLARQLAAETFVLLKNEGSLLPLQAKGRIALIGPMGDARNNMCGMWSVTCDPWEHVTLLDGLRTAVGNRAEVLYAKGSNIYYDEQVEKGAVGIRPLERGDNRQLFAEAMQVAARADVIVAAVGECADMSGESASRTDLRIPDAQRDLLKALVKTGKPVVLVLFTGRPLELTWEAENVPAILNVWFAGSEAGDAIADVLFGKTVPSGKLTTTFPRSVGQMPLYYNQVNTGRPDSNPQEFNRYQSNYIDCRNDGLYPFGYGLSYTSFEYGNPMLSAETLAPGERLTVTVPVTNTGACDGTEIVQLYLRDLYADIARPVKELKGFRRVFIKKGETCNVTFTLTTEDLKYYNADLVYKYDAGEFLVMVGPNSRDTREARFQAK